MRVRWASSGLLVLLWALACAGGRPAGRALPDAAARGPAPLTVVTVSDLHGQILPKRLTTPDGATVEVGGARWLGAYIARVRETAPGPVLVVDAGDLFQGTLESNLGEGAAVIALYRALGIDAAALGNHEFDYGPVGEAVTPGSAEDDPRGALKARIREASFPILACNVIEQKTGRLPAWLRPSVLVERGGVRIGVVGAAGVDTPTTTVGANLVGLDFLAPAPCIAEEAAKLRARGARWVVATVHIGAACAAEPSHGEAGCHDSGLLELARRLGAGPIDLLVGGHTHQRVARIIDGLPVIEAWARGQAIGVVQLDRRGPPRLEIVSTCGAVVRDAEGRSGCDPQLVRHAVSDPQPAVFRGKRMAPDARAEAAVAPWVKAVAAKKAEPLGVEASAEIWAAYLDESPLGNLVAGLLRKAVPGADVGMTNGGGLRAPLPAGPLTYGNVYEALPFDNRLAILHVDGATLRRIVQLGVSGGHGGLSWDGLSFETQGCQVGKIWVQGKPLDPKARYEVVTNDYLARGGSGFADLGLKPEEVELRPDLPILRDVVAAGLRAHGGHLDPAAFYNPEAPRQRKQGRCDIGRKR